MTGATLGQMDEVSAAIGALQAEVRTLNANVSDMKRELEALTGLKNRGFGWLAGVGLCGGIIGAKFDAFLALLK